MCPLLYSYLQFNFDSGDVVHISEQLNMYDVEAITLGSIVALMFLNIALDSLYTAVMAKLAWALFQKEACATGTDEPNLFRWHCFRMASSDEAIRKRGSYEIGALQLIMGQVTYRTDHMLVLVGSYGYGGDIM